MQAAVPLACFLSVIRPPGVQFENAVLQIAPVDKSQCPYVKDNTDITFQLYTRHNPTEYQELLLNDDEKLFASNIDFNDKTVIYFHAFMEQPEDGSAIVVREAYMLKGDTNVIMVDAHNLEAGPWYFTAAHNTWYIGRFAGQFIDYLVTRGLNLNNTHLVGHSLGAHSAGVTGASLKTGRVSRITGLDPALPLFSHLPLQQRLDPSDAHFVDVIHTDAGIFGYKHPIGHVDFYPNGGKSPQPGCELEVVIPQQLLLNKCDAHTQTRGYYTYHLTRTKKTIKDKLLNLFEYFQAIKARNVDETKKSDYEDISDRDDEQMNKNENNEENIHKTVDKPVNFTNISKDIDTDGINTELHEENNITVIYLNDETEMNTKFNEHKDSSDIKAIDDTLINNNTLATQMTTKSLKTDDTMNKRDAITNSIVDVTNYDEHTNKQNDKIDIDTLTFNRDNEENEELTSNNSAKDVKIIDNKKLYLTDVLSAEPETPHKIHKRQKRFVPFLKKSEDSFLTRMLDFLIKNRKNVLPVLSVMREINTLVKTGNGVLNHVSKEQNSYIGAHNIEGILPQVSYTLELGSEPYAVGVVKRLLGLNPKGSRLSINGSG